MVTALMVSPGGHPEVTQLVDDRKYLDCAVSRDTDYPLTAAVLQVEPGIVAIHSYEGSVCGTAPNRQIGKRIVDGTFYIVGVNAGKLRSLTDEEVVTYTFLFWEPEFFAEDEVIEAWVENL